MPSKSLRFIGDACPVCGVPMFRRNDGEQNCLSKWRHRTIDDILADIADAERRLKRSIERAISPTPKQEIDIAFWLDNPSPLIVKACSKRLATLRAELVYRQAGGPPIAPGDPIPDVTQTCQQSQPAPARPDSPQAQARKTVTSHPRPSTASKPSAYKPSAEAENEGFLEL